MTLPFESLDFRVYLDWDHDGWVNLNAGPSTPLNVVPTPVLFKSLSNYPLYSTDSIEPLWETTDYGLKLFHFELISANLFGGSYFGVPNGSWVGEIPVTPGASYTLQFWTRLNSSSGHSPDMRAGIQHGLGLGITGTIFTLSGSSWTRQSCGFTAPPGVTSVFFLIIKDNHLGVVNFDATGFMVIPGSTPETYFNAGGTAGLDNISGYVESLSWNSGLSTPGSPIAPPSNLEVILSNVSGDWSVESGSSPFNGLPLRGTLVEMYGENGGTLYRGYRGRVTGLQIAPGPFGARRATLNATCPMADLAELEYVPSLLQNVNTGSVLTSLFDQGLITFPYPTMFWCVGVEGSSEIGMSTSVYLDQITDFEEGSSTYDFIGQMSDRSNYGVSALGYIRDLLLSELGGRFYWNPITGKFVFTNRDHDNILNYPSSVTVTPKSSPAPVYRYGADVINAIDLEFTRSNEGSSSSVLYSMTNLPYVIPGGGSKKFTARFQDPENPRNAVAVVDPIIPVSGTDYTASFNSSGSNTSGNRFDTDYGNPLLLLRVSVNFKATSAEVSIENTGTRAISLNSFQLRGTPLTTYDRQLIHQENWESIAVLGKHFRKIYLPYVSSADLAYQYAAYLCSHLKDPTGRFSEISLSGAPLATDAVFLLGLYPGVRLTVDDSFVNVGHTEYQVRGLSFSVVPRGILEARVLLDLWSRETYWRAGEAGFSEAGTTTIAGL